MTAAKEVTKQYRHAGVERKDLKPRVMADEKQAVKDLGGPVRRKTKFINGGADMVVTWRRA